MEQYGTVCTDPARNSMEQYRWCCPKTGIADKTRPEQCKSSMKQHTDQYGEQYKQYGRIEIHKGTKQHEQHPARANRACIGKMRKTVWISAEHYH
jgi:hypothetical protein